MTIKIFSTLGKIFTLSIITTIMMQASIDNMNTDINTLPCHHVSLNTTYQYMSTTQLQMEVEKHSTNGDLPFELGKELIRRWTKD